MNNIKFSTSRVRAEIESVVAIPGWSVSRLAREAGIEPRSLTRFMSDDGAGMSTKTLEPLWPYLYGDKRPKPQPPHDEAA
jgi:hypothetical protein